ALVPWRERDRALVRLEGVLEPVHLHEDPADAHVRQRPIRRDLGGLAVGIDRGLVPAPEGCDVAATQGVLVALVERAWLRGPRDRPGPPRPLPGLTAHPPRTSASSAFWTWSRFSDWSQMMLRGPSITEDVISSSR